MSGLQDEPFEKMVDDKDLIAYDLHEAVTGTLRCNNCDFRGKMDGTIPAQDKSQILFICPKCQALEKVKNPEYPR